MSTSICVIGVGGGGSRLAGLAAAELIGAAHVVAINTDAHELDLSAAPIKLQIGAARTGGLGAGGAMGAGRLAAEDDVSRIRELVAERQMVIVVAGLGGGTGSGAAPVVLRAAGAAGALTLAVVMLPFDMEGRRRKEVGREALRAVQDAADAVVVVSGDRLAEASGETTIKNVFARTDALLAHSISTLCNLIAQPGYINLDFADLQQMVQHSGGTCSLGYAETRGPCRAAAAVQALLEGKMLEQGRLLGEAASVLTGIVGGSDLTVQEVGQIMQAIEQACSPGCSSYVGTFIDDQLGDAIRLVTLVSEFWTEPPDVVAAKPQVAGVTAHRQTRTKTKSTQTQLGLQPMGRGRFRNVEPTLLDGEDLDIPTFVRRGIALEG